MSWLRKKVEAPSGQTVELDGLETYVVRWTSRYGEFSHQTQSEAQAFISKQDAEHFAQQLRNAFKLIKHTSGKHVTVERQS